MKKIFIIFLLCLATVAIGTQLSFNSGQLSTMMKYRVDMDIRSMGAEKLENVMVKPTGMAYKRPGTEFIDEANDTVNIRLIPFEYSTDDSYVLEFGESDNGNGYIGFVRTVP